MHILHVDNFFYLLVGVSVDEEVFSISPPLYDYFLNVPIPLSDLLNNGRCIGDGCRWEKIHFSGAQLVWGAGES